MTNGCDAMNHNSLREYAKYVRNERRADIAERLDEFADQWRLQYDEWRSLGRRLAEAKGMADEWERQYDALRGRLEAETEGLRESLGTADETIAALREAIDAMLRECGSEPDSRYARNACIIGAAALTSLPEVTP